MCVCVCVCYLSYGTCQKGVPKTVHFVCIARCQRFPKNGVKRSGPFHSMVCSVPFYIFLSRHVAAYSQSVTVFFFFHANESTAFALFLA